MKVKRTNAFFLSWDKTGKRIKRMNELTIKGA
jgi:hypothetical protein